MISGLHINVLLGLFLTTFPKRLVMRDDQAAAKDSASFKATADFQNHPTYIFTRRGEKVQNL